MELTQDIAHICVIHYWNHFTTQQDYWLWNNAKSLMPGSSFVGNDEFVAVEDFIDVGNVL